MIKLDSHDRFAISKVYILFLFQGTLWNLHCSQNFLHNPSRRLDTGYYFKVPLDVSV